MSNDKWQDNSIQFPRLLAEIQANIEISEKGWQDICSSMDINEVELEQLWNRAGDVWETIKENARNLPKTKMKFTVYHAKNPTFGFGKEQPFPEAYKKVALVEADSIDDVFRITNHIDSDWRDNPEVKEHNLFEKDRSTSVGDVVVDENGVRFYCAPVGWTEMEKEDAEEN